MIKFNKTFKNTGQTVVHNYMTNSIKGIPKDGCVKVPSPRARHVWQ